MTGPIPAPVFDPVRLEAVRSAGLLDTDADEPFDRLARLAAEVLQAPLAFVTVVDERRSFWKSCIGVDAAAGEDRQNPVEESFCQYVVGSGERLIVGNTRENPLTRSNPSVETMGVAAWAGFPVHAPGGEVLGSFCVVDTKPREWTDHHVAVLKTLSEAASGEVALRMAAERSAALARTLQESLLPPSLPEVPGLQIAATYVPAGDGVHVLGDFYDIFRSSREDEWHAVIGDVCGKGIEAAQVTALAHYTLRAAAMGERDPAAMLRTLNDAMLQQQDADLAPFLTAAVVSVRVHDGSATGTIALAGHPPPLAIRAGGAVEPVGAYGSLLGRLEDPELHPVGFELGAGEALLLFTDGVTEARTGADLFGDQRLAELLEGAGDTDADALVALVRAAVVAHSGGRLRDDMAVLVLRVP